MQFNLDYTHQSGFYLGTFLSNIKWLKDAADVSGFSTNANIEWDLYGGYHFEVVKDVTLDVGYLRYEYPSSSDFNPKPNTDEVYIGVSYGPFSAKYSYSINDTFGVANSKGSDYLEIDYNQPLTSISDKLTLNGVRRAPDLRPQRLASRTRCGSSARPGTSAAADRRRLLQGHQCGGTTLYTVKGKDWSKDRLVGFVTYSFWKRARQQERTHETGHGHHQAVQARRGARSPLGDRRAGHHRHGGEGLRPAERPHGAVPRRRVRRRLPARR